MITAVRYEAFAPKDETRYLNPTPQEGCLHTNAEEIHFWVTVGYATPVRGSLCMCGEKKYYGIEPEDLGN